jgi:hypothetical protein
MRPLAIRDHRGSVHGRIMSPAASPVSGQNPQLNTSPVPEVRHVTPVGRPVRLVVLAPSTPRVPQSRFLPYKNLPWVNVRAGPATR